MIPVMVHKVWLILFIAWGLPLTIYRSRFRKIVYQTDSWTINIKPYFHKEIKALFGNIYPGNIAYLKSRNFYRMYLTIYVLLFSAYTFFNADQNMRKTEVGSPVPRFTLADQNGKLFSIDSVIGKKNLVIYFYPKDDSPGCTAEACYFRDELDAFREEDAMIIGISGQSVNSHKSFDEKHKLGFTLLSDEGNKVRKMFGVPVNFFGMVPGRVTYIIDKSGTVVYIYNSQTKAKNHVDEALRILKGLK